MGDYVYVGFTVECPEVPDAHITIAFIPVPDPDQNPRYDTDTYGGTLTLMHTLYQHLETFGKFSVVPLEVDLFGANADVEVIKVSLPSQVEELVTSFRSMLYVRGIKYSLDFPFLPHITIREHIPGTRVFSPDNTYDVTGLFIDNGKERRTLHLK